MAESFLDAANISQMVIDAEIQGISEHLFNEWMNGNQEDGEFWADYRFAEMCDSKEIKDAFNKYYGISEGEDMYLC